MILLPLGEWIILLTSKELSSSLRLHLTYNNTETGYIGTFRLWAIQLQKENSLNTLKKEARAIWYFVLFSVRCCITVVWMPVMLLTLRYSAASGVHGLGEACGFHVYKTMGLKISKVQFICQDIFFLPWTHIFLKESKYKIRRSQLHFQFCVVNPHFVPISLNAK